MEEIVNRVAKSPLVTLDLKEYLVEGERVGFDMVKGLFQGLILKEKDFRSFIRDYDWTEFENKHVFVFCSTDSIIPNWAYMLVVSKLHPIAATVIQGSKDDIEKRLYHKAFDQTDFSTFTDKKLVVKGCSDIPLPQFAFTEITNRLLPFASSIMYGEPCSTVPVYKAIKKS